MSEAFRHRTDITIMPHHGVWPTIHPEAMIASGARIIGDVTIGARSTIWFNVVIRGDVEPVTIGEETNIQDGSVIHVTRNGFPTHIGSGITIGHSCLLHACILEDHCFIGMGSIVIDRAIVASGGMLGAGSLLTSGKRVGAGELWSGRPATLMRAMTEKEQGFIAVSAANYTTHGIEYKAMGL
jgi:carbonic anhydrase/acetyltransferase-like protein (isoleucine patch superfamily)